MEEQAVHVEFATGEALVKAMQQRIEYLYSELAEHERQIDLVTEALGPLADAWTPWRDLPDGYGLPTMLSVDCGALERAWQVLNGETVYPDQSAEWRGRAMDLLQESGRLDEGDGP